MLKEIKNKNLLLFSVITVVLIGGVSYRVHQAIAENERNKVAESLHAVLDTTHQAISSWINEQETVSRIWAKSLEVKQGVGPLLASHQNRQALINHPVQKILRKQLKSVITDNNFQDYYIIDRDNFSIAASIDENVGIKSLLAEQDEFLRSLWSDKVTISVPVKSDIPFPDKNRIVRARLPVMFVGAPVKNEKDKLIAVLIFRINPYDEFTAILQKGHLGDTGETYAFDKNGTMLSTSLFEDQSYEIGLLEPNQKSILNIQLRDPGVNLFLEKSNLNKDEWPLTKMALDATSGISGLDVNGYRDYRGILVVGAWYWDDKIGFGIATEVDYKEAFKNLNTIRIVNIILTVLTILLAIGGAANLLISRRLKEADNALRQANDELEEKVRTRTRDIERINEELKNEIIERGKIQSILREERDLAEGMIDTAQAIILVLDQNARIVRINKYMEELSGYTQEEVKGKDWIKTFLPDNDQERIQEVFNEAIINKPTRGNMNPIVTKNGKERMIEWYDKTLKDANGETAGLLAIGHDVTERILTEKSSSELLSQNRNLMQRMFQIQEEERKNIARELHDEFGQWLTAIQLDAQNITNQIGEEVPQLKASANSITDSAAHIQKDIRTMIHDLRPTILDDLGLCASLEELVSQWKKSNPGIGCNLTIFDKLDEVNKDLQITIYRLVQEGLTNIARYARAREIDITFKQTIDKTENEEILKLTIVDDGIGFDTIEKQENKLGLLGMRERVLSLGGEFSVNSVIGEGTSLQAEFVVDHRNIEGHDQ